LGELRITLDMVSKRSDHGPLVLALYNHPGRNFLRLGISIHAPNSSEPVPPRALSGVNY
jgi:hypothetical protein